MTKEATRARPRRKTILEDPSLKNIAANLVNTDEGILTPIHPVRTIRQLKIRQSLGRALIPVRKLGAGPHAYVAATPLMPPEFNERGMRTIKVNGTRVEDFLDMLEEIEKRQAIVKGKAEIKGDNIERAKKVWADERLAITRATIDILLLNPTPTNQRNADALIKLLSDYFVDDEHGFIPADDQRHKRIAPKLFPISQLLAESLADSGFELTDVTALLTGSLTARFVNQTDRSIRIKNILGAVPIEKIVAAVGLETTNLGVTIIALAQNPAMLAEHPILTTVLAVITNAAATALEYKGYHAATSGGIFNDQEERSRLATQVAIEKIKYYGGLMSSLYPALVDIFVRKELRQKSVYINRIDQSKTAPGVRFLKRMKSTMAGQFAASPQGEQALLDANPADKFDETTNLLINRTLPELRPAKGKTPITMPALSDFMIEIMLIEFARSQKEGYIGRLPVPTSEAFPAWVRKVGKMLSVEVKKFSAEATPELAVALALPLVPRFAANLPFAIGEMPESITRSFDMENYGARWENRGNTGFLPRMSREYFKRLYEALPQSYMNKILLRMKNVVEHAEFSFLLSSLPETASSQPFIQALSTIAFFNLEHQEVIDTGSVKQLMRAMVKGLEQRVDRPENLLMLMTSMSTLNAYMKLAPRIRDAFGYDNKIIDKSVRNMREAYEEIVIGTFQHFLRNRVEIISGSSEEAQQFTLFLAWVAKESPDLLNYFANDIQKLYGHSGEMAESHTPSIRSFFTFFFAVRILQNAPPTRFDIDTQRVQPFIDAVIDHVTAQSFDLANINLGRPKLLHKKELKEGVDDEDTSFINDAATLIEISLNVLPKPYIQRLARLFIKEAHEEINYMPILFDSLSLKRNDPLVQVNRARLLKMMQVMSEIQGLTDADEKLVIQDENGQTLKTDLDRAIKSVGEEYSRYAVEKYEFKVS